VAQKGLPELGPPEFRFFFTYCWVRALTIRRRSMASRSSCSAASPGRTTCLQSGAERHVSGAAGGTFTVKGALILPNSALTTVGAQLFVTRQWTLLANSARLTDLRRHRHAALIRGESAKRPAAVCE
jgi:hypothetical protein